MTTKARRTAAIIYSFELSKYTMLRDAEETLTKDPSYREWMKSKGHGKKKKKGGMQDKIRTMVTLIRQHGTDKYKVYKEFEKLYPDASRNYVVTLFYQSKSKATRQVLE